MAGDAGRSVNQRFDGYCLAGVTCHEREKAQSSVNEYPESALMRRSFVFMKDSLRLLVLHRRNIGEQFSSQAAGWSIWADEVVSILIEGLSRSACGLEKCSVDCNSYQGHQVDRAYGYRIVFSQKWT